MKIAKNIQPRNYKLTEGAMYPVLEEDVQTIKIANDSGKIVRYYKSLFEITDIDIVAQHLDNQQAVPVVELTNDEILRSIFVDFGFDSQNLTLYKISLRLKNGETLEVFTENVNFIFRDTDISCGIQQVFGIHPAIKFLSDLYENQLLVNYSEQLANLIFKDIVSAIVDALCESARDCNAAMFILSYVPDKIEGHAFTTFIEFANNVSDLMVNPNTGNEIELATFYV